MIFIAQPTKQHLAQPETKVIPIKSFIYYAPKLAKPEVMIADQQQVNTTPVESPQTEKALKKKQQTKENQKTASNNDIKKVTKLPKLSADNNKFPPLPEIATSTLPTNDKSVASTQTPPAPKPKKRKLDSFTQLQNLRSKLNQRAASNVDNPYQDYQAPSIFNTNVKSVPHSVPLRDEEKEREKRTKNMGSGIAITKGEDGVCSITQDMSAYGLSEGSSRQFFSCGESKFDKNFREHMKKVKAKIGKN